MNKILKRGLIGIGILFLVLLFIRIIAPTEMDDVHPNIPCEEMDKYNPDIIWVIPFYEGVGISSNPEWCEEIKALDKKIGMHGISHEFEEFNEKRNHEYIQLGIQEFEVCFGYKPEIFKAPQLKIIPENKQLILDNNMELKDLFNQIMHKVYHCENMCNIPNWLMYAM